MTFDFNTILDFVKVILGLTYLYLEYKARASMWIVSVFMPVIGMVLFFNKGLYADCAINLYYLAMAVYGWYTWTHGSGPRSSQPVKITHVPLVTALYLLGTWVVTWGVTGLVLTGFTDSTVPWLDSFTTSLSIVGTYMLARKYLEQWGVWLIVDSVYVYLYFIKGIYFSGALYCFYTVMAVAGYSKWRKMMNSPVS